MKKILKIILILILIVFGVKYIKEGYNQYLDKQYEKEIKNISEEDLKVINEVINLAKERVGQEYTWGGKGEVITEERINELISEYGESYYPLDKEDYIGIQGFDCSGLTYWTYKKVTGVEIGYSTIEQKDVLKDYKIDIDNIQPGDLIFTPGHVVMYMGRGKIIESASRNPYPIGGIKVKSVLPYKNGIVYRPIDYINKVLSKE